MNKKIVLTIFTPTYNRAYILPKLYQSLCLQSNQNFMWLVINDGSTDNTNDLVESWIKENKISIQYITTENGGKQRAHNCAVEACETELFCCVDSDDFLTSNAIEEILCHWENVKNDETLAGVVALRGKDENTPIGNKLPNNMVKSSLSDLYKKHGFKGDTMLIFRTDILRQFPFVVCEGEKFMGEGYVYIQIDQKYSLSLLNRILYICQYLDDGYTNNTNNLIRNNPKSYLLEKELELRFEKSLKRRCIIAITFDSVCFLIKDIKSMFSKPIFILMIIPGYLLNKIRFRKGKRK